MSCLIVENHRRDSMLRRITAVLIVVLSSSPMILAQATTKPTTQEIPADPSTPKGTLTMLSRATESGDSSNVKDLFHATNPQEQKLAGVLIERTEVYARFRKALV